MPVAMPPWDLAFNHDRVDGAADILHQPEALERHGTGVGIHLDLAKLAAASRRPILRLVARRRRKPGSEISR